MAFNRPTLTQIKDRVEADIKGGLGIPTILKRSFEKVIAAALAGASHTLHGYITWALKQFFADTADEFYLIRTGKMFGVFPKEATFAEIEIEVTGTNGTPLPDTAFFQRTDGALYKVKDEVTISGGTALATIVAQTAGSDFNLDNGDLVSLSSPIAGINSSAEVQATLIEGENAELIEDYRVRVLERMRNPPAGGTVADYIAFAKTVAGVTRVWVFPGYLGQGTVAVSFVEDNEDPIIPSPAKVEEVRVAVEERQPIPAMLTVFAPAAFPINPIIKIKPNTQAVRDAVTEELKDLIFREAQIREAVDPELVSEGTVFTGKIPLSKINEAISLADGEDDHELVFPTETPQPSEGGLLTLGTITFQTLT